VVLSLCALTSRAQEEPSPLPSPLSLPQALQRMREHGFDVLAADAAVRAAQGDARAAAAFPNPLLSGGGGHTFHYDPQQCAQSGCSATQWSGAVSDQGLLADLVIGKRRLRSEVADAALAATRLQRTAAERELGALVAKSWVDVAVAGGLERTAEDAAHSADEISKLVTLRWHAGDVSEADAARAETAKLEADQSVDEARENVAQAKATLAFLLGERGAQPEFEVASPLPACVAPSDFNAASAADLLQRARAGRPDLAAAKETVTSAELGVSLAERARIPDVALSGSYVQEGTGNSAIQPPTAALALTVPLPLFYQGQGEVEHARAQRDTQQIALSRLDASLAAEVSTDFASWQSAQSRVSRMESITLARARRALELTDYQYRRGAASLLELLDAQRTFTATEAEYQQNVGDWWSALYQLESATGEELHP
jgi:outer membrane protein, heavy metal efflux system